MSAQFLELARVAQKLNQFTHFFLGFLYTGNIGESDLDLIFTL